MNWEKGHKFVKLPTKREQQISKEKSLFKVRMCKCTCKVCVKRGAVKNPKNHCHRKLYGCAK